MMSDVSPNYIFIIHTYMKCFCISQQSYRVISGFRRDADEICALLGYYAASNGNPLPTLRDNVSKSAHNTPEQRRYQSYTVL
jgi:hypothetical protein